MFNIGWGILYLLINFCCFLICYKWFGKKGLYAWIGVATVVANIQVVKTIEMFGIVMTLGNTMYITLYLTSDLLNEKFGRQEAKKAVWFGFFTLIMTTVLMQMVLVFEPQPFGMEAHTALETIFGLMPRLALGSLAAYFVSQFLDVRLYTWIRNKYPSRNQLWIRNNGSTMISSFVDTLIFCSIAFLGEHSFDIWLEILFTTYIIKFILSAIGTPFLYIARNFEHEEDRGSILK